MALWLRFPSTKIILFRLVAAQGVAFRKVDLFYCWKSQAFIPTAHVRTHKPCGDFIFHVYCCVFLNWVLIIKDKKKSDLTSGSLAAVFWKCESESYNTTCFSQLDASIKLLEPQVLVCVPDFLSLKKQRALCTKLLCACSTLCREGKWVS